jgi:outer membrane protein
MSPSKIHILTLSLGLSAVLSTMAFAQAAAAPASAPVTAPAAAPNASTSKVGVVNIQQAIAESNEGKKEFDALQQKFTPRQNELKGMSDEVDNLKKQYQAQGDKLSEEERASRAKAIDAKQKVLQRNFEDAQAEFQQAEQEVLNRIGAKMLTVLSKYANANGYTVVLDVSNPQTSPVLWATQGNVITKELVDAYNTESSVPTTSKPAATNAKPAAQRPAAAPSATPKKP